MTGVLTAFDLSTLPAPEIIQATDYAAIVADDLAKLRELDSAFTALVESDPAYKLLEVAAYREILLRQRINEVALKRLLAFAEGGDLDQLGAFYGVQRLVITPADPDASPPVSAVLESDAAYKARLRERIRGSSAAGPAAWYRFHALSAHPDIKSVEVDSPSGGIVRISVLSRVGDGTPSPEIVAALTEVFIAGDDVSPLCHTVQIVPARVITVDVSATIVLLPGTSRDILDSLKTSLRAAFGAATGLGWDVTRSWISARLQAAGVHSVTITSPAADLITDIFQSPALGAVTLDYGGRSR